MSRTRSRLAVAVLLSVLAGALSAGAASAAPIETQVVPSSADAPHPTAVTPAAAVPAPGFDAPTRREVVYGDFAVVGNGVLRCPTSTAEEGGGGTYQDCRDATRRTGAPAGNNQFDTRYAGADLANGVFDASTAAVTLPAGAAVAYAQLSWSANTGGFTGIGSGLQCVDTLHLRAPPTPPAALTPDQQPVRLTVGDGTTEIAPADQHYAVVPQTGNQDQFYTAWADVTAAFPAAATPTGSPLAVTAANIWGTRGLGCSAGWSLLLVYGFPQPTADFPVLREVDVFTAGYRHQAGVESTVTLAGPAVTANPHLAVVAYDGDRDLGEDVVSVDGTPAADACAPADDPEPTGDFFSSCANGALDPVDPGAGPVSDNLSVDAKDVPVRPDDDGVLTVDLSASGDVVTLQQLVVAQDVTASLSVSLAGPGGLLHAGDDADFTVTLKNTGLVALSDVSVVDANQPGDPAPACAAMLPDPLAPGAEISYSCREAAPGDYLKTVTATGHYRPGAGVTDSASAQVRAIAPALSVQQSADRPVVREGEQTTVSFTVRNNGVRAEEDLTDVTVATPDLPGCRPAPSPVARLAHGESVVLTCRVTVAGTVTSTATATGTDVTGAPVRGQSTYTISTISPALSVTQQAQPGTVHAGEGSVVTATVANDDDSPAGEVRDVRVTEPAITGCTFPVIERIEPLGTATTSCTVHPAKTVTGTATATGADASGQSVTAASDPVTITVIAPRITVQQVIAPATIRRGGSTTATFTVHNNRAEGSGDITDITVSAPALTGCAPGPIATLAPGADATVQCTVKPAKTVSSTAVATGKDVTGASVTGRSAAVAITVINPALTITVTASPRSVAAGGWVEFNVVVRNTGDVALTVAVTNDNASACDFTVTGAGLPAGAAQGRKCTVQAPVSSGPLLDNAAASADPAGVDDDGPSLAVRSSATVQVKPSSSGTGSGSGSGTDAGGGSGSAGGAGGSGGVDGSGTGSDAAGGPGSGSGSGSGDGSRGAAGGSLPYTGLSLAGPIGLASALLLGGSVLTALGRRRRVRG